MRYPKKGPRTAQADFLPVTIVLLVGVVLSALAFFAVRAHYKSIDRQRFQRDTAFYGTSFKNDVERQVASLAAMHAFVSASRTVDRWEFSAFAHQILPQNSGFKAVLWIPRIEQKARKSFEAKLQRDGLYGLHIRETTANGDLINAGTRPMYLPVAYIQPFDGNGSVAGLDLSIVPTYARLFRVAQQTGRVAASPPVSHALVEAAGAPTVLVAFPLLPRAGTSEEGADRNPQGYVLGVLQLSRIVEDAIASHTMSLEAAISYGDAADPKVFTSGHSTATIDVKRWIGASAFSRDVPFDIAGQRFHLLMRSAEHEDAVTLFYLPLVAALLALALTALLVQSMLSTILRKQTVERAVVERTAELQDLNAVLKKEIEQRRISEAEARGAKEKAEAANRSKSVFLSTMSHELRTPLNAIIGFSGLLRSRVMNDAQSIDYVGEIHDSGHRLLSMINDILDITQIDAETAAPDDFVCLGEVVDAVLENICPAADKAGISLRRIVPENLPLVRGDGRRLGKALTNLVSNAVKFTERGGWAQVEIKADDAGLAVEVSDNGVGMPPGAEARMSELFSQFDSTLARGYEGAGLGLAFVRRVVELHGSVLTISSVFGKGTRVSFVLPADRLVKVTVAA